VNFYIEEVVSDVTIFVYANRFDQRSASLVISDRGILSFDFMVFLGTFHWYCPFGLYRFHVVALA